MKYCLLLFTLITSNIIFAQADNPDNLRSKLFELKIKTIPPDSLKLPFESIQIIDARADTSKLGFFIRSVSPVTGTSMFQKIILSNGIAKGIEKFYNEYYKNNFTSNGKILFISIKKLWIDNMPNGHSKFQRKELDRFSMQNIHAKFEYYSGVINEYVPLKAVDTVFQLTPITKVESYDASNEKNLPFFCFALEKMLENINYENYTTSLENRRKMNLEEIIKYNYRPKDVAILNESIKTGVFMNFEEFKNNKPTITNFSKRKIPKKKIYEIADEKNEVILNYFAYYDGDKLAKSKALSSLSASNISQDNFGIYRIGNSYQFFENLVLNTDFSVNIPYKNTIVALKIPANNLNAVPRQIDLETGEIY